MFFVLISKGGPIKYECLFIRLFRRLLNNRRSVLCRLVFMIRRRLVAEMEREWDHDKKDESKANERNKSLNFFETLMIK
jgi:hypothetical protein